jgi:hypothetical protein
MYVQQNAHEHKYPKEMVMSFMNSYVHDPRNSFEQPSTSLTDKMSTVKYYRNTPRGVGVGGKPKPRTLKIP